MLFYSTFGKSVNSLKGKVIWITGASSGIGEELAVQLAAAGAKLAISGTRKYRLEEVKKRCLQANPSLYVNQVHIVDFDLADLSQHKTAIISVCQHFGRLDILVNNAGKYQVGHFEETDQEVDKSTFDVNLFGAASLTRLAVKHWLGRKKAGHVAVTSSVAGLMPTAVASAYSASKHAVHGYFEALRSELFYRDISVTIAVLGPVDTQLFEAGHTTKKGERMNIVKPKQRFPFMTAQRAAQLYAIALANRVSEPWLVVPQILGATYLSHYFTSLVRMVFPWAMTESKLESLIRCEF
jgi:dehydrogenase/reductase SDR family protein 7